MLEKPDLQDVKIADCLRDEYGLKGVEIAFLPLGADVNSAVYRAVAGDGVVYFVKLRHGVFDAMTVEVPRFLYERGVKQIIPPLETQTRQLSTRLEGFNLMLYRFVEGHNGYEVPLSDEQWIEFGRALKQIHTTTLSPALMSRLPQETYSPKWRELVRDFQRRIEHETFADPIAAALAAFLNGKRDEVSALVERAERLSSALQTRTQEFVLCHTDIHVANLLIDVRDNALYIVDWDNPLLAPKERDLMFVGGGVFESARTLQEEESLFYQGYGQTEIDPVALAYYRYERIAQDIAAYCEQLLLTDEGGEDRAEGLRQLTSQFLPGGVIDVAYRSDRSLPREIQE